MTQTQHKAGLLRAETQGGATDRSRWVDGFSKLPPDIRASAISAADAVSFGGYEQNAILIGNALFAERQRSSGVVRALEADRSDMAFEETDNTKKRVLTAQAFILGEAATAVMKP